MGGRTVDWDRRNAIVEDAEWIAETGGGFVEAARRIGLRVASLDTALRRAGRADLITRLRRNEPDPHAMRSREDYCA